MLDMLSHSSIDIWNYCAQNLAKLIEVFSEFLLNLKFWLQIFHLRAIYESKYKLFILFGHQFTDQTFTSYETSNMFKPHDVAYHNYLFEFIGA